MTMYPDFSELKGKTLEAILRKGDEVYLQTTDGQTYRLYHEQDCCENVYLADVSGDPADLLGEEILVAEERSESGGEDEGSFTYTFYNLQTMRGDLTLRWNGSSNGYYSMSVGVQCMPTSVLSFDGAKPLKET